MEAHFLTPEGKERLEKELEFLLQVRRLEVAEHIRIAREDGDLSENAGYDAAKEEQAHCEGRIMTLEGILKNSQIIQNNGHSSTVVIGLAAVLTAIASYQGAQIDGQIDRAFAGSLSTTIQANNSYNLADAERAIERDWIFSWIAEVENGTPAGEFLGLTMPKKILALAAEWATATDGSLDPFSDGILDPFSEEGSATYDAYRSLPSVQSLAEGDQLSRDATCSTFEAQVLSRQGARKGLSTIFLAIALVVGGVAALLRGRLAQNIVLATSVTALIAGAGILAFGADVDGARADLAPSYFEEDVIGEPVAPEDAAAEALSQCESG